MQWYLRYGVGFTNARILEVHPILTVTVPLTVVDVHPWKAALHVGFKNHKTLKMRKQN